MLFLNVVFGGMTWEEAVKQWLEEQIAVQGSREAVEDSLRAAQSPYNCSAAFNESLDCSCDEIVGKFGDGKWLEIFKNINWQQLIATIISIINMIPKSDTTPVVE